MLKTISAALLAASVIAAPALAAETGKTTANAPVIKAEQTQTKSNAKANTRANTKANAKADIKVNSKAMNANASMTPDEHHKTVRAHRHHHKMVAARKQLKTQPDAGSKPTAPATSDKHS